MNKKAFTLVELIVVITILAILATIGFISFQGYTESSRDSVRLSDMANIEKGFNLMLAKDQKLPVPEDKIDITASGTVLTYQGYAGQKVLGILSVNGEGKDPLDNVYYTYATNPARNKYQLLGFFENQNNVSMIKNTYADFTNRFPKVRGDELGILTDAVTKEPVQKIGLPIDVVTSPINYNLFLNTKEGVFEGTGSLLSVKLDFRINENGSCKAIKLNGNSTGNGMYEIVRGTEKFTTYCDMSSNNGGWTLLATTPGDSAVFGNRNTNGIWKTPVYNFPTPKGMDGKEFLSKAYESVKTNEILLCYKNMSSCHNFKHNMNISFFDFFKNNISYTEYVSNLNGYTDVGSSGSVNSYFATIGKPGINAAHYGICQFLGINPRNSSNFTSLVIGFGGDGDGPCISRNNSNVSALDNYGLGVAVNLWYARSEVDLVNHSLAGFQSLSIPGFTPIQTNRGMTVYQSEEWYIFGK